MSFKKSLGKTFVLLIIILILLAGGLLWFDYLGVVHVKSVFSPMYKVLKKSPQTSSTATQSRPLVANLDEDRLRKQREALDIFKEELVTQMLRIVFLTAVIEDLGVRSARAFTDLPEVVFCLADVAWIQIGLGRPDAVSFIVIRIDGDIHAALVKTDPLR